MMLSTNWYIEQRTLFQDIKFWRHYKGNKLAMGGAFLHLSRSLRIE